MQFLLKILGHSALQVQALVAEHKLGAQGRKLGIAMTKQLIDTPERLAHVKPPSPSMWATNKCKPKSRSAKKSKKQASRSRSKPRLDPSRAPAAQSQTAEEAQQGAAQSSIASHSESDDGMTGSAQQATVRFTPADTAEDIAEVRNYKTRT